MESFIERPAAPSAGRQLLVFVLDGSPSMLDAVEASAVVLMLTDGECETPEESRRVADRLREDPG